MHSLSNVSCIAGCREEKRGQAVGSFLVEKQVPSATVRFNGRKSSERGEDEIIVAAMIRPESVKEGTPTNRESILHIDGSVLVMDHGSMPQSGPG